MHALDDHLILAALDPDHPLVAHQLGAVGLGDRGHEVRKALGMKWLLGLENKGAHIICMVMVNVGIEKVGGHLKCRIEIEATNIEYPFYGGLAKMLQ